MINAGSFFLKNSEWTRSLLQEWKKMEFQELKYGFEEQGALAYMLDNHILEADKHVFYVPLDMINSYAFDYCGPEFKEGDFVLHAPGTSYNFLVDYMKDHDLKEF